MINGDTSFSILRLLETPGVGVVRVNAVLEYANNLKIDIGELLSDQQALLSVLTKSQVHDLFSNLDTISDIWQRLQETGVSLLSIYDNDYPDRLRLHLGKKAPPLLSIRGNKSLLSKPSVGFCGSRKASNKGLATAHDCASQLVQKEINIISGYAAGVDMATHRAALECGGTTTLVLAEGILKFKIKHDLKNLVDWQRVVVVSEFLPGIPWSIHNAMQRNQTICALSRAMILIEAGSSGGSIEAGKTCLKLGIPLFAPVYEGMPDTAKGNQELLGQGARPLLKNRQTNMANISAVLTALSTDNREQDDHEHTISQHSKI